MQIIRIDISKFQIQEIQGVLKIYKTHQKKAKEFASFLKGS